MDTTAPPAARSAWPKPSQINTDEHFYDSVWQNSEFETVARSIVIVKQRVCDNWHSFDWEEYRQHCGRNASIVDLDILIGLVDGEYLVYQTSGHALRDGKFCVTAKFIAALAPWVRVWQGPELSTSLGGMNAES